MMDDDLFPILLIVLLGGAAVWYLMNRKDAPTVQPKQPCNVSVQGVTASCDAISKGVGAVVNTVQSAVQHLPLIGTSGQPASLEAMIAMCNKNGIIYEPKRAGQWNQAITGQRLPAGYVNCVPPAGISTDRAYLCPASGNTKTWVGVPPAHQLPS